VNDSANTVTGVCTCRHHIHIYPSNDSGVSVYAMRTCTHFRLLSLPLVLLLICSRR
jgi:hypothetical protein